jgi:hypothetical protein
MISAQELADREKKRLEVRKSTYKAILEQLCRKIKHSSELGEHSAFLQIPLFMVGYPAYDIDAATEYIQRQLVRLGYKAIKVAKGTIGISWGDKKASSGTVVIDHSEELPSLVNLQKTAASIRKVTHKR